MELLSWFSQNEDANHKAVDIATPRHKANPFPFYAKLREEHPVHRISLSNGQRVWLVSRYDDAVAVLKDDRFAKDKLNALRPEELRKQPWVPAMFKPLTRNMLDLDPPDHARLRGLVQKAFTPRLIEQMRPRIESIANGFLDKVAGSAQFDLIRDYALPIPTTVISNMLGVPADDKAKFHRWSKAIVAADPSGLRLLFVIPHVWAFLRYIRRLIRLKRVAPRDDLLTLLVEVEDDGSKMNEDELVAMAFLLLVAGHETTVNLMGNGMLALLENPGELQRLRSNPELIEAAVEELLRFAGPLEVATERYAREDLQLNGVAIPLGSLVYVALSSANRDSRQFAEPDRLILDRQPNRHLAFGMGRHFCLGASLARVETQIAISTLLRRTTDLKLAVMANTIRWRRGLVIRGMEKLPLSVVGWK